ncbi:MAG: inositol-3-phosphate synthase, partial [Candidatus Bathyarchaeota archaeon]|nr:inositol-3-phosphate synthase [Candidatus Bathyarchaeota archaeon]
GVGNCFSSLLQGVYYYGNDEAIGLRHAELAGYKPKDIRFVAAFDIADVKVGKDISEAIWAAPNNVPRFADVPKQNVKVQLGSAPDVVAENALSSIKRSEGKPVDVTEALIEVKAEIFINLISGGSDKAGAHYAQAALDAGCSYVNATPSSVASDPRWIKKFERSKLPLVGDDLLDQVGATVLHIGLLEFLVSRGVRVDESYQLDVGGGSESINTLEKTRDTKRLIKTAAVTGHVPYEFPLVSGSTDFVDFLGNGRDSFFWVKGRIFGGLPFNIDVKLSSFDSPNGGSVLLDVIRGVKIAKDKGFKGSIAAINSYGFKKAEKQNLTEIYKQFRDLTE